MMPGSQHMQWPTRGPRASCDPPPPKLEHTQTSPSWLAAEKADLVDTIHIIWRGCLACSVAAATALPRWLGSPI
ncbi:hypothetical protein GGTG_06084 [Gaeumannomyces tritici R3-111a-1]|uniref:Uncharacterized protein n=1 Tax=Gaeumannomyces tritici (strain R3-111a-1) TaxID=644352 RepID=J3NXS9_GAET3|nr:hypothetical protein GGTG_06084 [Gaeumannomyces tritici R3-111a-1]EJT76162.1 hypothetical protein GGTG_06084 [Gaeumannomyces tritici R3-111a-1]